MGDEPRDLDKEIRILKNGIGRRKRVIKEIENDIKQAEFEKKIHSDYLNQEQEKLKALRNLKKNSDDVIHYPAIRPIKRGYYER